MRVARRFVNSLGKSSFVDDICRIEVKLRGSLALTGEGHGTPKAVLFGLMGHKPETLNTSRAEQDVQDLHTEKRLSITDTHTISFDPVLDVILDYETPADLHPNEMECVAYSAAGESLRRKIYYSTGGGFIASYKQLKNPVPDDQVQMGSDVPFTFGSATELLGICKAQSLSIADVILLNEDAKRERPKTEAALQRIADVMLECIDRGLAAEGLLPGHLKVQRRASALWDKLQSQPVSNEREQLFDWLNVYAMAVNEENAAGGQVVTAPTNGAAGIIPSVLRHYCVEVDQATDKIQTFLLTAGGIGLLYKQRASISGAEMGCQGEVGVACSMAAGGLAAVWGGTPNQIAQAAEIGMEHNLGLTCDPVGGLVQIPCIERNAIGAVKAVNAARLALHSDGPMKVTLDQVIETMRQTGEDMSSKYKETSQGGLAVNVVEC